MYKIILFDLDGTLTESKEGIINSIIYALQKLGIEECDLSRLQPFIGPPLLDSFIQAYGFSKPKAELAVQYYRENFSVKGIYENKLYNGILQLLDDLVHAGKIIVLATSKPLVYATEVLNYFGISEFFSYLTGSGLDGSHTDKTEIIKGVIDHYYAYSLEEFIMIGDRKYDIEGAKNNGIASVGVLYGYGAREELEKVMPEFLVHHPAEIKNIIFPK